MASCGCGYKRLSNGKMRKVSSCAEHAKVALPKAERRLIRKERKK
jgi:hypothetical protein